MNKRERVIAAFHGKEVDHVPVCMWQHVPPEYWDDDDKFAKCQLDAYKHTDVDFVKLSADKYFGWPDPVLNGISSAKQLYDMKPLGAEHPFIRGQIERTKKIVQALNGECVALYLVFAPISYLRLQVGYPMMMQLIREDPEANPLPSVSGKFEIYCQAHDDLLQMLNYPNREAYKPYPTYVEPPAPVGYAATFKDGAIGGEKGDYPYLLFNPHYLRRSHTVSL